MDDLKLYAQSQQALQEQLEMAHRFSRDIHMDFGLDKSAKITIKTGKRISDDLFTMDGDTVIQDLGINDCYKYLGVEESNIIVQKKMSAIHTSEYIDNINKILKTYLSPKNKMIAINQITVFKFQYSFDIIYWPQKEINSLDTQTRKLLIKNNKKFIKTKIMTDSIYPVPKVEWD